MIKWHDIATAHDIAEGQWKTVTIENINVAVYKVEGEFYAIENICTHDGSPLVGEPVENCAVVCPRHGAKFCLRTGTVLEPPAYEDIRVFAVRVEGGVVQVMVDRLQLTTLSNKENQ